MGTVANTIELSGTVAADTGVQVRSSAEGEVVHLFAAQGDVVEEGEALFQVRRPADIQPEPEPVPVEDVEDGEEAPAPVAPAPLDIVYEYYDVLAAASGTLTALTPLLGGSMSIGQTAGTVSPGTYHVFGTLTAAQQFRLLDQPSSAVISITGGSAPFTCTEPRISEPEAPAGGGDIASERTAMAGPLGPPQGPVADEGSTPAGELSCDIPAEVPVFAGLAADVVLSAGVAEDVVTVPTTAVKGSIATGIVWVQDAAGEAEEREVKLGLNDGSFVEITEMLDRVGLGNRLRELPHNLSGGEQQRVAIARALVRGPQLILADEPTGALDLETGAAVMGLLDDVAAETGAALVTITHDTSVAARARDHYHLDAGVLTPLVAAV